MTTEQQRQAIEAMKSKMSDSVVVTKAALYALIAHECDDVTRGLLLHEAREELNKEGVVFLARSGTLTRADWRGIERQATRQATAGQRKRTRAERKLRLAAELAPEKDAERLREKADRELLKHALASQRYKVG